MGVACGGLGLCTGLLLGQYEVPRERLHFGRLCRHRVGVTNVFWNA